MGYEIINGDCLVEMPKLIERGVIVDAIVTDSPYKDYDTGRYDGPSPHVAILRVPPSAYVSTFYKLLGNTGAVISWLTWDFFEEHRLAYTGAGFEVRNQIVWGKPNHTAGDLTGNVGNQHEVALFAVKGDWKLHGKRDTNLWLEEHLFSRAYRHHPTEKPIGLMRRSARLACPQGGLVLDPFAGSFTTGVACVSENRSFIGIERDEHYCEVGEARMKRALGIACDIPRRIKTDRRLSLFDTAEAQHA